MNTVPSTFETDIIVVGGGLAGLTAADHDDVRLKS